MSWVQVLFTVLCLVLIKIVTKVLLGDFFYSGVGNILGLAIPLIAGICIARMVGRGRGYQFLYGGHLSRSLIGMGIPVVCLIFLSFSLLGGIEELVRIGSVEFHAKKYIFGWSKEMKENFMSILLFAPILEESFFNGTLLPKLSRRYTPIIAVFIVSFIFLSFHLSLTELRTGSVVISDKIALLLMTTFNSIVVLVSSDIRLAILFHFIWNLLSYLFPIVVGVFRIDFSNPLVLIGFSAIIVPLSIFVIARGFKRMLIEL